MKTLNIYQIYDASFFALLMAAISLCPLFMKNLWHKFENKFFLLLVVTTIYVIIKKEGYSSGIENVAHVILSEYVPFMAIVFALYTVASGIYIELNLTNNLKNNVLILLSGTCLASFIGTTGASVLLIRPFLRLNKDVLYKKHLCVFFIFLVSNIGGSLTPLGDPPLFIGYILGVDFFWTLKNCFIPFTMTATLLFIIFIIFDKVKNNYPAPTNTINSIKIQGFSNVILVLLITFLTIGSSKIIEKNVLTILGQPIELKQLVRDLGYIFIGITSLLITKKRIHALNHFNFAPVIEVGKIFIVIFITLVPISSMLNDGLNGPFRTLLDFINEDGIPNINRYFWSTGLLSAFLDNAPTYLIFFKAAGNNAHILMNNVKLLLAISLGSVFMGALTYIGNAPNMMVYSISKHKGFKPPHFTAYMIWSAFILIPIFLIMGWFIQSF